MRALLSICLTLLLTSCGFHLQGQVSLAPPLQRIYLQTADPYGQLAWDLTNSLKMSKVQLVASPEEAQSILVIHQDNTSQSLLSVSGTQQTRQYKLRTTVSFEITDNKGRTLLEKQALTDSKVITVQSSQILGSSNEADVYYQEMRQALAYAIINRIASQAASEQIAQAYRAIQKGHVKP